MPPRFVVAIIVFSWIGSIAYLIHQEYLPWWRTDAPPPFLIELADEATPLEAQWVVYRGEQRLGSASTRMICLRDETVELSSTIDNLEINQQAWGLGVQIRITDLHSVQRVTRSGQLLSVFSRVQLTLSTLGQTFDMRARLKGSVKDGKLYARSTLNSPFGKTEQDLEPIPIEPGNALNPMQPIAKVRVRPGQHWKLTNVDPLGEATTLALQQLLKQVSKDKSGSVKLKIAAPKALLAQVGTEPREWSFAGKSVSCHVIEYRSEDREVTGSTWVAVEDGKVMRQEVTTFGETLILERND